MLFQQRLTISELSLDEIETKLRAFSNKTYEKELIKEVADDLEYDMVKHLHEQTPELEEDY